MSLKYEPASEVLHLFLKPLKISQDAREHVNTYCLPQGLMTQQLLAHSRDPFAVRCAAL